MEMLCWWVAMLWGWLLCLDGSRTLPIHRQDQRRQSEGLRLAESYLGRFYNLTGHQTGTRRRLSRATSTSALEERVKAMQGFFGLEQTGALDPQTLAVMREARCGVSDVDNFSLYPRRNKWKNHTITYRIAQYTPDMKREDVEDSFRSAFRIWSDMAPLTFVRVNRGKADIILHFARRTHGDFSPFDGPGGVLAHAFEPGEGMGGDVHFDEDETWTTGKQRRGYSLFAVAAHELGHSLGLSHSRDPSAVMYPHYRYYDRLQHKLSPDDILGIQTIYGKLKMTKKAEAPTISRKCDPGFTVDAVAVIEREIVFFKNRNMWMRTTQGSGGLHLLREGHLSTHLPGVNAAQLDAAYDIPGKGAAYIFTGHKYWVVQRLKMRSRPGSIYEYGLPASVRRIDAALYVSAHQKTFFFVGNWYYRYDERKSKMESGFPRLIHKDWPGIRRVDAAFELHGYIYLFSGTKAYQYDVKRRRIVNTLAANIWLGC